MFSKEQLQRFSIRKLTVGTASVLIGVLFLTSWNTNKVYADSRNVASGESIAQNNNPQEGNPAVNKDNVQIIDNNSTEVSNISDSKSSKVIKSDATKSDIVRDKTTIDDNSRTKVPELTAQANNKQALTTVTEDNGAKVSKTEKYSNSDIKNQSRNSEKAQETTLVKKVLEKKVLDKEKLSSESLIDQKKLDGKVEIPATDPSNTITATDPSNYPKLNGLIGEDKYIYQVLSLEPEYWYSRSKLILSVNRNDPNDKNIYAYVIDGNYNYNDGNYNYNSVEKSITIGMDKSSIITIDGREYRLNNNGSSEVSINGKTVSTQNSSTVTSKPRYLDNLPISQDYGLGNTSNGNCSAIGEIVPVFTKNSVIKYYYRDNEGHLQEFKNSELPNVSVEGFTGQEFEIDDVGQYKKVIQGYHLTSAPTGNFKGTLSQFSDDKYYKKVYYDFGTNKVKYSVLYHQIYPDGTMEVWLVDGKGDALTETRKIAPNTSTEFSDYNCTVRNPYVTAAQHEVQFIYSPDAQHMTITYVDDTTGKTLLTVTKDGVSDGSTNYNTKNDIDGYKAQHYNIVSDSTNGHDLVFDHNDNVDQHYEVHLSHATHPVDEAHDVSQVVHYIYTDGSKAANDYTNQVHFTRDGYHDEVTNEDHWNSWKPSDSHDFAAVHSPKIQGFTPDIQTIDQTTATPSSQNIEQIVTYYGNVQLAHVKYIDDSDNGRVISLDDLNGHTGETDSYTTAKNIKNYTNQGYVFVSDNYPATGVVFDNNDLVDQDFEVHFKHGTHSVSEDHDISQIIHYVYANGSKAANDHTNQVHFTRDGYHDEVTNEDHWNAWKPAQQEFASVKSPEIQGYTADQVEIPVIKVNSASDNIEHTVTYKANKQKLDVAFIDDTTGETLLTVTKDGVSDGSANYNTANDLDHYKSLHFNVVSDGTQGQNLVFDHDDSKDQHYEVHLVHATHSIDDQTTKSEAIHYVYADGLARQGKVTDDNVQQLSFKRDGYNDEVTGTDHWNAWTPANSQYEAVDSPVIQGYTPDKSVIEKSTVNPTDKDIEITVTYNADKQTAHVIYVDKTTNTTLISDDLSGKSDKDSEYNTEDKIGKYKSQHYVLVEDETNGKNVIFDHNDKQDQTYYVYFVHGEQKVNRQNTVTATIDYKFEDGKTAQPTVTQTKHFSEGGVKDLVTGKIAWDEAKPQKFDDVTTPAISGYTPDKDKVAGSTVKFGDKDIEVTVTYHNNAQKASVTYIDDKTGKTLKVDNLNGVTNAKSGYTTKAAIDTYTGLGYTLVSDDTNGKEVVFDNDDAVDQAFTVHLSHGTITVTPENPGKPGEPVDPDNPDGPKYRAGTDKTGLTDTVNRTITYVMSDGSKAPEAVHDSLSYTASKVIDKVTLEVLETKWSANQDFKDVDSPNVKGYTPDKKTVSNKNVAHDAADITETVKYSADAQKASVTYIDDKTGKTLKVDNLNGVTNAKSGYTTKAAIDTYTGLGYTLVSDDTNGKEVVFDNDDAVDQAFTVHLSHGTITVTPENPGKPGEPVDPDNPDGPKYPDGTDEYQVKRTGTQTIHYVGASDKTPADNKQTFVFTREITFDDVTGKIISVTPWNVQSHTFGNVDTPVIPGYHADKAVAGGATVTPDDLNRVITVTYAPDGNPGNPGDQGDTPTPEPTPEPDPTPNPTPDDQPDSEISSDEHFENVKAKDKLDKTNPKKMDAYKKERKIIKTKIAKQDHTEIAEPKLPQTGEADNSIIGLLGMLLASFAAMFGFDSLHSHDKKHKN